MKRIITLALILCFAITLTSYAAENQTATTKAKETWKKVVNYPAKVVTESTAVVADTGKKGVGVVTKEVERVGEVTTGDVAKIKEMVVEPLTGTTETAVEAVKGTVKAPVEAAKEKATAEKK